MAGHSKWANIKHRKGRVDASRAKLFTKLSREIIVAAKEGGPDTSQNPRLRMAVQKAKDGNMPNDRINRNIEKATGKGKDAGTPLYYKERRPQKSKEFATSINTHIDFKTIL